MSYFSFYDNVLVAVMIQFQYVEFIIIWECLYECTLYRTAVLFFSRFFSFSTKGHWTVTEFNIVGQDCFGRVSHMTERENMSHHGKKRSISFSLLTCTLSYLY